MVPLVCHHNTVHNNYNSYNSIFTVHKFVPYLKLIVQYGGVQIHLVTRLTRAHRLKTEVTLLQIVKVSHIGCGMKFTCCSREVNAEGPEDCYRIGKLAPNSKNYNCGTRLQLRTRCGRRGWQFRSQTVRNETIFTAALITWRVIIKAYCVAWGRA